MCLSVNIETYRYVYREVEKLFSTLKEKQVQKYKEYMQIQNVNTEFFQKLDQCLSLKTWK